MADVNGNEGNCSKGCQRVEVPTEDEIEALKAMREIKDKVRQLTKKISEFSLHSRGKKEEIERLEREVEHLKREWKGWEEKRKEAARVRMVLLGHEKPD